MRGIAMMIMCTMMSGCGVKVGQVWEYKEKGDNPFEAREHVEYTIMAVSNGYCQHSTHYISCPKAPSLEGESFVNSSKQSRFGRPFTDYKLKEVL